MDYTLHAGKRALCLREDEAQKEEKGKYKPERERNLADGVLPNPLKHPYIASTSSPSACKRQGM